MIRFLWLCAVLTLIASPADAAAAGGFASFFSGLFGTGAGAGVFKTFIGRLFVGAVVSRVSTLFGPKPQQASRGIQTSVTQTGGTNPQSLVLGRYTPDPTWIAPPIGHTVGATPREYLVFTFNLCDMRGAELAKLFVNGSEVSIGGTVHPDYGNHVEGEYDGRLWVKYYNGTQTAADPMMLDKYSADPHFPWSADMVGYDTCIAIVTARFDPDFWGANNIEFLFEMQGLPLYDVRKDSTAGGSGSHRWNDPSTWEPTDNPVVMIYNIMRGIALPTGEVWGGESERLPVAVWAAAMNECDVEISLAGGGTEPQYRAGIKFSVDEEPHDVILKLLRACSGDMVDVGGEWHIQVGAPPLPVYFFTDRDIMRDEPQEMDPFPSLDQTVNGATYQFPNPATAWQPSDLDPITFPDLVAADNGEENPVQLEFEAVPYGNQAQRLARQYVLDGRRFIVHSLTLPPDAISVNPLETVAWTSEHNGYSAKLFEVHSTTKNLKTLFSRWEIRERDPSDYDWSPSYETGLPAPAPVITPPAPVVLPNFGVEAVTIDGDNGVGERPAIKITFDQIAAHSIAWTVRKKSDAAERSRGIVPNATSGEVILPFNAQPATEYQVNALVNVNGRAEWTDWIDVTTDDVRIKIDDLDPEILDAAKKDSSDALDRFIRNSHTPAIRAQEGYSRESSVAALKSLKAELALRQGLKESSEEIASEAVTRAQEILNEAAAREQGDNALSASLASLSITVSDNAAAIVQEALARSNEDGTLAADIAAILVTTAQNAAAIVTEQTARADGDTANADAITALGVTVGQNTSDISAEQTARADADTALANNIASVLAITGSNTAAIGTEQTARTTQDAALAADIAALTVTVGTNTSDIVTEQTTRASEDAALAASIASLLTTVNGNTAAISTENSARVAADLVQTNNLASYISSNDTAVASANTSIDTLVAENLAQAALITALSTTHGNHTNSITTLQQITSGQENVLQVTSEINGALAGYALRSAVLAGGEVYSDFTFVADAFRILSGTSGVPPFVYYATATDVDGVTIPAGTLLLEKAMIGEAWIGQTQIANGVISTSKLAAAAITAEKIASSAITADKLAANSITTDKIQPGAVGITEAAGVWQSANYVPGVSGVSINWETAFGEWNDLVVRGDMLEPNAISTKAISTPSAGSIPGTSSTASISGHSASDFVNIGVSFTHRYAETTIQLKVGSESWQDLKTFELNANSATRYFSFMHSGTADTVQVRLSHVGSHSSKSASNFRVISQIVQE